MLAKVGPDQRLRMKGAIIGAALDHGLAQDIQFKRYPTCYECYTLGTTRTVYVSGREDGVWQFSVGVPVSGLDGAYTLPINHKMTGKTPQISDEENVLRKIESGRYCKRKKELIYGHDGSSQLGYALQYCIACETRHGHRLRSVYI
jgi:hypothetical protein